MLSITSSQECSIVQLVIPIVELLARNYFDKERHYDGITSIHKGVDFVLQICHLMYSGRASLICILRCKVHR